MAIYAMSDIHGMYEPFIRRIKQLNNLESVKAGKDKLILLGDYIDIGNNSFKVLKTIYELQKEVGADNMIVLMGNHDKRFIDFLTNNYDDWISESENFCMVKSFISAQQTRELCYKVHRTETVFGNTALIAESLRKYIFQNHHELIKWYINLPYYYKTASTIFVHAGIDEEAVDLWEVGTSNEMFIEKYPHETGYFYMNIVAGHVSTSSIAKDYNFHDIYYDGQSHFYIDGIDSYMSTVEAESRSIPVLVCEENGIDCIYYSLKEDGTKTQFVNKKSTKGNGGDYERNYRT